MQINIIHTIIFFLQNKIIKTFELEIYENCLKKKINVHKYDAIKINNYLKPK